MDDNYCSFIGRLAADPIYHPATESCAAHAVGRLIVNRPSTRNGKNKQEYDTIPFSGWGPHAETLAKHAKKGKEIQIRGQLRHNPVNKNGSWYNYYEILIEKISLGHDSSAAKLMKATQASGVALADLADLDLDNIFNNPKAQERLRELAASLEPSKANDPFHR